MNKYLNMPWNHLNAWLALIGCWLLTDSWLAFFGMLCLCEMFMVTMERES